MDTGVTSSRGWIFTLSLRSKQCFPAFSDRSCLINKKDIKRKGKEKRTLGWAQQPRSHRRSASTLRSKLLYTLRQLQYLLYTSRKYYTICLDILIFHVSNNSKGKMDGISFFVYELAAPSLPSQLGYDFEARARQIRANLILRYVKTRFPWWPTSPCRSSLPFRRSEDRARVILKYTEARVDRVPGQ